MINRKSFLQLLDNQNIEYKIFLHPALFTVEDSKEMRGEIQGAHTKNLFLKNKKNNFFLFSCLENSKLNLKIIKKNLNLGNISFARDAHLREILKLEPGAVTPFGLLNDINNKVAFYLDEKLIHYETLNFHPLENTATVNINTAVFLNFMKDNNKLVKIIDFDTYTIKNEHY